MNGELNNYINRHYSNSTRGYAARPRETRRATVQAINNTYLTEQELPPSFRVERRFKFIMTSNEELVLKVVQGLQHEVCSLSDANKGVRKRSLSKISKVLLSDGGRHVLLEVLQQELMKVLLKSFSDPAESCRNTAISTVSQCISILDSPVPFLPLIVPVMLFRITSDNDKEPSEEIRLTLIQFLAMLIQQSGRDIASYAHDAILMLKMSVVDPYPEVKKESCTCCALLARTVPEVFLPESELLTKPFLQTMTHQHSKVRCVCVKAFGDVVQYGSANSINDALPILAQRVCDQTASVRVVTLDMIGKWLLNLLDRYSYHHKLIPLFLTGLSDDVIEIQHQVHELWKKIGLKYQEENEEDMKDQMDFSRDKRVFPELGMPRPSLGCRILVYRSFSKILPAILKDIIDWTVNSRIKSSQLLGVLVFHLEDHIIHHLHKVLESLYRACGDDESVVASEAAKCCQVIGFYVPMNVWIHFMLQSIETHSSSSHSLGCYIALANILRGCYLSDTERNIGDIKSIGRCLDKQELLPTENIAILDQLLNCVEGVMLVSKSIDTFPESLSLNIFSTILKISSNQSTSISLIAKSNELIKSLAVLNNVHDVSTLYLSHMKPIIELSKKTFSSWDITSSECALFASLITGEQSLKAVTSVLSDIIPIFSYCTSQERDPEMQLKFLTLLIELIMGSTECDELASELGHHSTKIVETVFIPSCIWKAGRSAATIRTAALTGVNALFLCKCLTSTTQVDQVLEGLLPQVLSSLDDDNLSTRTAAIRVLKQLLITSPKSFTVEELHKMFPYLLKRLDDVSNEVRLEAISSFSAFFKAFPSDYDPTLHHAHIEMMYRGLLIHLDDPSPTIQEGMMTVLKDGSRLNSRLLYSETKSVRDKHRTTEYCDMIMLATQN